MRAELSPRAAVRCSHHAAGVSVSAQRGARGRQNTIVVKVPGQEDSHNEDGSGSEASDSVSNCGQSGSQNIGNNVTLITLNSKVRPLHTGETGVQWPLNSMGLEPQGPQTRGLLTGEFTREDDWQ